MSYFSGKKVLVTGAGRGLGRALSWELAHRQADLVLIDLHEASLRELEEQIRKQLPSSRVQVIVGDLCDSNFLGQVLAQVPKLDVLINNAGVVAAGDFLNSSWAEHERCLRVNLESLVHWTYQLLPLLLKATDARLIQIASASAFLGFRGASSYAASKWGVLGFSESLDLELRANGIHHLKVCVACPSYIQTELFEGAKPPKFTRVLTVEKLASRILGGAEKGKFLTIEPLLIRGVPLLKALLPYPAWRWLLQRLGADTGMSTWNGRRTL